MDILEDILKSESKIIPGHKIEVLETMIPQLLKKGNE